MTSVATMSKRPWVLAFIVLVVGCSTLQRAFVMIAQLHSGSIVTLGPTVHTTSWWPPASSIAIATVSCFVAFSMLRKWQASWILLTIFWCLFAVYAATYNVLDGRIVTVKFITYSLVLVYLAVMSTIIIRRSVGTHAP